MRWRQRRCWARRARRLAGAAGSGGAASGGGTVTGRGRLAPEGQQARQRHRPSVAILRELRGAARRSAARPCPTPRRACPPGLTCGNTWHRRRRAAAQRRPAGHISIPAAARGPPSCRCRRRGAPGRIRARHSPQRWLCPPGPIAAHTPALPSSLRTWGYMMMVVQGAAAAPPPRRRSHDRVAPRGGRLAPHRLLCVLLQQPLDLLLGATHHVGGGACAWGWGGVR